MLVLTRKVGETVCIGDDIEVRIVSMRGQKVRVAIEAPQSVAIRRKELPRTEGQLRMTSDAVPARSPGRRRAAS